jgi:hypothetical protein
MSKSFKRNILIEKKNNISLQISSVNVKAKTRKLRASWSPEIAQDLHTFNLVEPEYSHIYKRELIIEKFVPPIFNPFSAEEELTAMLSQQISDSIDREILREIFNIK